MDYLKIYDSLTAIKNLCHEMQENRNGCRDCPLSDGDGYTCCVIAVAPDRWKVKDVPKEIKLMG